MLIDHTTTSDYQSLVEKNFRAMPIGYLSFLMPPHRGPIIWEAFPESVYYGEFCGLFETIFFRCGYWDTGLISKVARKNPKLAKALADAAYYWETIGVPIVKRWLADGAKMAAAGIGRGISGKPAPSAFKTSATIKDAMGPMLKMSSLQSGKWAADIMAAARAPFDTSFQTLIGGRHLHFEPNKAYMSAYCGASPLSVHNLNYPYPGDCPPIMEENGYGLRHNMPSYYGLHGNEEIRDFEFAMPMWATVTQFTPLLIMNDELVFAHKRRIIRVREMMAPYVEGFCRKLDHYHGPEREYQNPFTLSVEGLRRQYRISGVRVNLTGSRSAILKEIRKHYELIFVHPESSNAGEDIRWMRLTDPATGAQCRVMDWHGTNVQRPGSMGIPAYLVRDPRGRLRDYPGIKQNFALMFTSLKNIQRVYPNKPGPNAMDNAAYLRHMRPWLTR